MAHPGGRMTEEDEAFEDLAKRQGYWGMQGSRKHQILRFTENVESKGTSMTPKELKAMKLALEALNSCGHDGDGWDQFYDKDKVKEAITALEEALADHAMREAQRLGQEIEQEPVAWVSEDVCKGQYIDGRPRKIWWECEKGVGTAFYTTPPQRTWVGLTKKEVHDLYDADYVVFHQRIEAKLKEKNT